MFTGIIEEVGRVARIRHTGGNRRFTVLAPRLARKLKRGDSMAVSGVCLTAVEITSRSVGFDLAEETWKRTSFAQIKQGAEVNLELAMRADGRFGGHLVQGHVDGTGKFLALELIPDTDNYWLRIEIPPGLARYVIVKGSLAIEGISLTVAGIRGREVRFAVIPHTLRMTNLKSLELGDPVNLEVDMIAKYLERMIKSESEDTAITLDRLLRQGF